MSEVRRLLPSAEAADLIELVRELADAELAPRAADAERDERYPRELVRLLGKSGLLGLPFPVDLGGGGQPYEVYVQVLEEVAARWLTVALSMSVHTLSCTPLARHGGPAVRRLLPDLLGGELLGAFCLSEAGAGSDAAALTARAEPVDGGYRLHGTKTWTTHGGVADSYTMFARIPESSGGPAGSGRSGRSGIGCFVVPADAAGLSFGARERKMGLTASPTASVHLDGVMVPAERLVGEPGAGLRLALQALDDGRIGIAACSVGLAQAALDLAVDYTRGRSQFGQPVFEFQGLAFMLAEDAAAVASARAAYIDAARRKDAGLPYRREAAVAKLVASDAAMRVTTDAVQALGGYGYTRDYPAERLMREAKVLQIFEGTNQIQRMVIARDLAAPAR
jgi:alkylation response protein AidB-like acyl-CoA dehydrogenase